MSILFDDARSHRGGHRRSTPGLWLSVALHALVALTLIAVPIRASEQVSAPRRRSIEAFVVPATAIVKAAPVVLQKRPAPATSPPMRERAIAEVAKPLPVAPVVPKVIEPPPAPPEPLVAVEGPIEKPVNQRPVETGLFDRTSGVRASQTEAAVTTGAFGSATASRGSTAERVDIVTTGGFSSGAATARAGARDIGQVQTAGFDQRASAPARAVASAPSRSADRPVEIIFKPTPEYTDDARSARVEGTVSLEIEFTAEGGINVLRVVHGLGYGLDEAARRAALRIRFKPAQSDGRPVDSRATVHITFRLS